MRCVHDSVDERWWLWVFILRFKQAALQLQNVVAESVVLALHELEVVFEGVEVADFGLELLDVPFFALAESSLYCIG